MTRIEEIEKAIEGLSADEIARLRAWFDEFEARMFDEQIERDAKAGKLDEVAAQALADHKAGRSRELKHHASSAF
jgi:hypothetical protein